jgi:hypothetical protein
MNKYLEKIAKNTEKNKNLKAGLEVGAGGYALSQSADKVLGYHNLHHGTSKSNAENIMKEGFKPSAGGSGAAKHSGSSEFVDQSKGKVHFTKDKHTARFFAGYTEHAEANPTPVSPPRQKTTFSGLFDDIHDNLDAIRKQRAHLEHISAGRSAELNPFSTQGKVLKARVSDKAYQEFEKDPHMGGSKSRASTTNKSVDPASIVGHEKNKGIKQFLNKRHLKDYYSTTKGKIRGGAGLVLGLGGVGLIGHAIQERLKNDK